MANRTLHRLIPRQVGCIHNDAVKPARHAVVYPVPLAHDIDAEIATFLHALRDGHIGRVDLLSEHLVEHLVVMQIHPRLNRRK